MKGSLIISAGLHALLLGFALSTFSSPRTLEVAEVEAMPIDIIPIEQITQIQQGDKKAAIAEKAAPKPTSRPEPVKDAANVGENTVDLKAAKAAKPAQKEVVAEAPPETAEAPVPTPEPEVKPEPKPKPVEKAEPAPKAEPVAKPVAEPAPEKAAEKKPAEVAALTPKPDPVAEAIENAPAEPQFESLPNAGPVPEARPKPSKPEETKQAVTKTAETKPQKTASAASSKKSDFNADEIASLLNKDEAKGGGAKRSTETASLGGSKTTSGNTLSLSEMDALRGQIQKHWSIIPGMADGQDVRVTVRMRLDQNGNIVGNPKVEASGGAPGTQRTLAGSATRAVLKAQPYTLPAEKYDSWSEVVVNFDPSQMF